MLETLNTIQTISNMHFTGVANKNYDCQNRRRTIPQELIILILNSFLFPSVEPVTVYPFDYTL